jgi:hypothetical protein
MRAGWAEALLLEVEPEACSKVSLESTAESSVIISDEGCKERCINWGEKVAADGVRVVGTPTEGGTTVVGGRGGERRRCAHTRLSVERGADSFELLYNAGQLFGVLVKAVGERLDVGQSTVEPLGRSRFDLM